MRRTVEVSNPPPERKRKMETEQPKSEQPIAEPVNGGGLAAPTLFALAFSLGFMVSREGFNGECCYDHCGPMKVEAHYSTVKEWLADIENSEQFRELRAAAERDWANGPLEPPRPTRLARSGGSTTEEGKP